MKMLVTGGAGFMGSNFVQYTVDHYPDYEITVLDKLTYAGNAGNLPDALDKISFVTGDVCDKNLVDELVAKNDIVIHFAAETHNSNSFVDPWPFINTNITGTATILEAVRKHDKILHHISTEEVFGDLKDNAEPFTEDSPYQPNTPHASTKASSDLLVRSWIETFGVKATVSAACNIYGPYQHVEKFIPRTITNVLVGEQPIVYGSGEQVRGWLHVDEHSKALHVILEKGKLGEFYLIGPDENYTNNQIAEIVLEYLGEDSSSFRHIRDLQVNSARTVIDNSKIKKLGWQPDYHDMKISLAPVIDWYSAHIDWWKGDKKTVESKLMNER